MNGPGRGPTKAEAAYQAGYETSKKIRERIDTLIGDMPDPVNPHYGEHIDWATAGSINYVNELLFGVVEFLESGKRRKP